MRWLPFAVVLLAGCLAAPAVAQAWHLGGSFTTERTQADIDATCAAAQRHGASDCALMESFPEQFRFVFASAEACEAALAEISAIPHVRPGGCARVEPGSVDPETPTSHAVTPAEAGRLSSSLLETRDR